MIEISKITFNPALISMLPSNLAIKKLLLPCALIDNTVYILCANPEIHQSNDYERYFGKSVRFERTDPLELKEKVKLFYSLFI